MPSKNPPICHYEGLLITTAFTEAVILIWNNKYNIYWTEVSKYLYIDVLIPKQICCDEAKAFSACRPSVRLSVCTQCDRAWNYFMKLALQFYTQKKSCRVGPTDRLQHCMALSTADTDRPSDRLQHCMALSTADIDRPSDRLQHCMALSTADTTDRPTECNIVWLRRLQTPTDRPTECNIVWLCQLQTPTDCNTVWLCRYPPTNEHKGHKVAMETFRSSSWNILSHCYSPNKLQMPSPQTPIILTDDLRDFLPFLQKNSGILPSITSQLRHTVLIPIHFYL
jgi:hypothetical protein